jgi:transcriptional regulator with XRE-family HTH domain
MNNFFSLRNEGGSLWVDGASVRRTRYAAELTQNEVSRRMLVLGYYLPQPYVSALERGKYRWGFTERMATALAAALGVGISDITDASLLTPRDVQRVRRLVGQLQTVVRPDTDTGTQSQSA